MTTIKSQIRTTNFGLYILQKPSLRSYFKPYAYVYVYSISKLFHTRLPIVANFLLRKTGRGNFLAFLKTVFCVRLKIY